MSILLPFRTAICLGPKRRTAKNAWRTHAFKINYICGDDTILYRQMRFACVYIYVFIYLDIRLCVGASLVVLKRFICQKI